MNKQIKFDNLFVDLSATLALRQGSRQGMAIRTDTAVFNTPVRCKLLVEAAQPDFTPHDIIDLLAVLRDALAEESTWRSRAHQLLLKVEKQSV